MWWSTPTPTPSSSTPSKKRKAQTQPDSESHVINKHMYQESASAARRQRRKRESINTTTTCTTTTGVRRECMMCCEEKVGGSFPSWTGRHAANHHDTSPGEVCFACWEIYLQMQIEATSTDKIKCAECNVLLAEADIRHLVGRTTYDK